MTAKGARKLIYGLVLQCFGGSLPSGPRLIKKAGGLVSNTFEPC